MSVEGRNEEATWPQWEKRHQPYELNYHLQTGIEWCKDQAKFEDFWWKIFDFATFTGRILGKTLDIGCGPRPPFKLWPDVDLTVVDPLAAKYFDASPASWWEGVEIHAQPAERRISSLVGQFDTLLCWNCLDHTVEYDKILENIAAYAKKDALIALSTDFHPPGIGHPGYEREAFMEKLLSLFDVVKERANFQERDMAWVLKKKS